MQEEESVHLVIHGTSDARSMVTGYKFTLTEHYREDMNTSYLLTDIEHTARPFPMVRRGVSRTITPIPSCCIPATVPFGRCA